MFETLAMAAPDPILGLTESFNQDPNPNKINLISGVYKDENGKTPILACVKEAEQRLLATESSKGYLPIPGSPAFGERARALLFGNDHGLVGSGRAVSAQTPGGTGALRVAAEFLHTHWPNAALWMSTPTWPNHPSVFRDAGFEIKTYPYYNAASKLLDLSGMLEGLKQAAAGDIVLLHGCCHNPSGMDPDREEWTRILDLIAERGLVPLFDLAYQGLGDGLDSDAYAIRRYADTGREFLVCSSFSKNFSLYNERVGALTIAARTEDDAARAYSHLKLTIRTLYSNPPAHGGQIVATVLADEALFQQWEADVAGIRGRINAMRRLFVERMQAQGVPGDYSFIARQRGMFSFSGLSKPHVLQLRNEHGVYMVDSGRMNVAGITPANIDRLVEAIGNVLAVAA